MTTEKPIDITSEKYSYDTSEAYTENCYVHNNDLLIPYINLQIIEGEPYGITKSPTQLKYCYLLIESVSDLSWIGNKSNGDSIIGTSGLKTIKNAHQDYFGINKRHEGYEVKLNFAKVKLYIPDNGDYRNIQFTPWETPYFPANLNELEVRGFLTLLNCPEEFLRFRKHEENSNNIFQFTDSDEHTREKIRSEW